MEKLFLAVAYDHIGEIIIYSLSGLVLSFILLIAFLWLLAKLRTRQAEDDFLFKIVDDDRINIIEKTSHFLLAPQKINQEQRPIIFYPGGLVSPKAYLYKMGEAAICLETVVYIIKPPFNTSLWKNEAAGELIQKYGLEKPWVGGHSLGGISACRYVGANPGTAYGLFLFGSYCDWRFLLKNVKLPEFIVKIIESCYIGKNFCRHINQGVYKFNGPVVILMGLQDKVINWNCYEKSKANLPNHAVIIEIEGLNHADFSNYGTQHNDGPSSLDSEAMVHIICRALWS